MRYVWPSGEVMRIEFPQILPRKYRVREIKKYNHSSRFYPQVRKFFFVWMNMTRYGGNQECDSLEHAQHFILDEIKARRNKKIEVQQNHPFNETFAILKKK